MFACPPLSGRYEDIDVSWLDPDDSDQRGLHVEAEHELGRAWDDDGTHEPQGDAGAHYAMHEVVANQLCDGDPPEVWATARRLVADGYERHEVLHMLASAVAAEWWHAGRGQQAFDVAAYLQRLDELPDSWELQREELARRPRGRRRRPPRG